MAHDTLSLMTEMTQTVNGPQLVRCKTPEDAMAAAGWEAISSPGLASIFTVPTSLTQFNDCRILR